MEKSPQAARRAARLILDGANLLEASPRLGRPLGDGRRELVLSFGSGAYILRYMLTDDESVVELTRFWREPEQKCRVRKMLEK